MRALCNLNNTTDWVPVKGEKQQSVPRIKEVGDRFRRTDLDLGVRNGYHHPMLSDPIAKLGAVSGKS